MKYGIQTQISKKTGLTTGFISLILSGCRRPSWNTAKKLADVTQTDPILWLEGTPEDIRSALCAAQSGEQA